MSDTPEDPTSGSPPPGWYPDPGDPRGWRWWDGGQWTAHVSGPQAQADSGGQAGLAGRGGRSLDPAMALAREGSMVRIVRFAFIAQPFVTLGTAVSWFVTRSQWHTYVNEVADAVRGSRSTLTPPEVPSDFAWTQLSSFLGIAVTVLLVLWVVRCVEAGRALGRSGPLPPWLAGLGFVIPLLNLWFPCQGLVQTLPPGDPARRRVVIWWLVFVAESIGTVGLFVLSFAQPGRSVSLAAAIGLVALAAVAAVLGERAADDVLAGHVHMAGAAGATRVNP